jgi:hypothetical protein
MSAKVLVSQTPFKRNFCQTIACYPNELRTRFLLVKCLSGKLLISKMPGQQNACQTVGFRLKDVAPQKTAMHLKMRMEGQVFKSTFSKGTSTPSECFSREH